MSKQSYLQAEFVEFIPSELENGIIYISERFSTASHLCCCGCGYKVVTPLNPAQWRIEKSGNSVSLYPSIGNWSFDCKSHYWIKDGKVRWSYTMSQRQIAQVKTRDKRDIEEYVSQSQKDRHLLQRMDIWLNKLVDWLRKLYKG